MSLGPKSPTYGQAPVPQDLQGLRGGQVDFLNSLFGKGGQGFGGLESLFGPMGSPATPLQRQSTAGISQFLNQPAPEQQAMNTAMPALQAILAGKPGQGVMDALQPGYQKGLAMADQQGGRFGSANAIMRSQALNDYSLLGAQAAQQGQQTQLQASDMLRMLSGQAGQNPFSRLMGAGQAGAADAAQADTETQRRLQLMGWLFGGAQQATMGMPYVQNKPGSQGLWNDFSGLLGAFLGGRGGGGGGGAAAAGGGA